jgi:hypothetical protein
MATHTLPASLGSSQREEDVVMKVPRKAWAIPVALMLVAGAFLTGANAGGGLVGERSMGAQTAPVAKSASTSRIITPQSCFASNGTTQASVRFCVTKGGNVTVEQPTNNFLLAGAEGYTLCDVTAGTVAYDEKYAGGGFGDPTIAQPNGPNSFPLTITRFTANFKLTQTFARDAKERDFTITMALKNNTGIARAAYLWRYFDGDLDGNTVNYYDATVDSVTGRNTHGLSLTAGSFNTLHGVGRQTYGHFSGSLAAGSCGATADPTPSPAEDSTGWAYYYFGNIAAGATKTVTFTYRAY